MFKLSVESLMIDSVERPFALVEEPVEIACLDSVETPKVPLGLILEVFPCR